MKRLIKFIGGVLVTAFIAVLAVYFFQERLIFLSETLPPDYEYTFDASFEEISIATEDGSQLYALHFTVEKPAGIVLYFHGNAGNLSKWGSIASQFTSLNYDVLMMDYRGYGKSTGARNEKQLYNDANLFYNKAKELFPESRIIVFGRSLGTTFATYVASQNKPRKLILESPFYSLESLAEDRYPFLPVKKLLKFRFNTASFIDGVSCGITIIHGTEDGVVPIDSANLLFKSIPEHQGIMVRIKNGKHNNLGKFQEYWLAIRKELAY